VSNAAVDAIDHHPRRALRLIDTRPGRRDDGSTRRTWRRRRCTATASRCRRKGGSTASRGRMVTPSRAS